jgi:hypothetical protein
MAIIRQRLTTAAELEEVLLFKLLKDAALDLHKLIADE